MISPHVQIIEIIKNIQLYISWLGLFQCEGTEMVELKWEARKLTTGSLLFYSRLSGFIRAIDFKYLRTVYFMTQWLPILTLNSNWYF